MDRPQVMWQGSAGGRDVTMLVRRIEATRIVEVRQGPNNKSGAWQEGRLRLEVWDNGEPVYPTHDTLIVDWGYDTPERYRITEYRRVMTVGIVTQAVHSSYWQIEAVQEPPIFAPLSPPAAPATTPVR